MNIKDALIAIRARIEGDFDNPQLESFGALSTSTINDIKEIISLALAEDDSI